MTHQIESFLKALNEKFPKGEESYREGFIAVPGRKYTKIAKSRDMTTAVSAYAFINNADGDLFRAAGWAAPAKHARGNINDNTALAACGKFGVAYLK